MDLRQLFKGIAVVIDDQIFDNGSSIWKIIDEIENHYDIRFIRLKELPATKGDQDNDNNAVKAFSGAVMIILDWMFGSSLQNESDEKDNVHLGDQLVESNKKEKINLIRQLLQTSFAPIFVFTNDRDGAHSALADSDVKQYLDGRLIVEDKQKVLGTQRIRQCLIKWLENNHESYVLKEWEVTAEEAKHTFFQSFGPDDVSWVDALWKRLKTDDDAECSSMLGEYLTRCIVNNMEEVKFDEDILGNTNQSIENGNGVIKKLVNNETVKWSKGENYPVHPHAGDMFYSKNKTHQKFILNLRADCDYSRNSDNELYFIIGKPLWQNDIESYKNSIDENGLIRFAKTEGLDPLDRTEVDEALQKREIFIKDVQPLLKNKRNLEYINHLLNPTPKVTNAHGKLLGHRNQFYLPISRPELHSTSESNKFEELKDMIAIRFTFELSTMKYKKLKNMNRDNNDDDNAYEPFMYIGRLLPPYINEIQEECAHWIFRTGAMPTPDEFYKQSYNI